MQAGGMRTSFIARSMSLPNLPHMAISHGLQAYRRRPATIDLFESFGRRLQGPDLREAAP